MAASHGLLSVVKLNDGSQLRDLSAAGTSCNMDTSKDTVETTGFGATSKAYIPGLKDATFSIEGNRDATIEGYVWAAYQDSSAAGLAFEYYPEGDEAGKVYYSANVHVTNFTTSGSTDDATKWSAEVQVNGDVTRDTVGS